MKPGREPLKDLALAFSRRKGPDLADYFQAHAHGGHTCHGRTLSWRRVPGGAVEDPRQPSAFCWEII